MANKGEWSELYVLFKIFEDKEISAADSNLEPIKDKSYKFFKVFRDSLNFGELEYSLKSDNITILNTLGETIKVISDDTLKHKTKKIFEAINNASTSSFPLDDAEKLMEIYLLDRVKAQSTMKTDLDAILEDQTNITNERMGFSIKSHIGGAPTLINPSGHTNFLYEIEGFAGDISIINAIDSRSKVRDRIQAIYAGGGVIKFIEATSPSFTANLRLTDTQFPAILAQMLLDFYSGKGSSMAVLSELVSSQNHMDISQQEATYKLQGFLRASALGMVPGKIWNTKLSTYGGYIVVLNNGELICYSLLKDDDFKEYLFNNTKFDTPSTTKYKFGSLYKNDGKLFINLNLQIRFTK